MNMDTYGGFGFTPIGDLLVCKGCKKDLYDIKKKLELPHKTSIDTSTGIVLYWCEDCYI